MIISGSKDASIKMWDLSSGDLLQTLEQDAEIVSLSLFPLRQVDRWIGRQIKKYTGRQVDR
jgi:hypothetical protein